VKTWIILLLLSPAYAHMSDRADLDPWFGELRSGKGMCCSFVEGKTVKDVDWTVQGEGQVCEPAVNDAENKLPGHYCVKLDNKWILVPDKAVITEPNRYGPAIVWPVYSGAALLQIRCFLRGTEG
jgi:hypothetical protein